MNPELLDDLLEAANSMSFTGEDEWPDELFVLSPEELMELLAEVARELREVKHVQLKVRELLTDKLGDGGKITDGHTFYRYNAPRERVPIAPEKVWEWLGLDAHRCFNLGDLKITAFRALARDRAEEEGVEDIDDYVKLLEDTLFDYRPTGKAKLLTQPIDRAPQYAAKLTPGKIYPAKGGK